MAPPVELIASIQPLEDKVPNKAIQLDANRVHRAMNSGLRPVEEEKQLDHYMHDGFMMVSLYVCNDSMESDGSMKFYDSLKTHLISEWTKRRESLVRALEEAPGQLPNSALVASMYLGRGPGGRGHAYRGLENRPQDDWHDTESYIYSAIIMQILTAWDESVRQGSTEFFDRQFADAIATWNQNRGEDVQPGGGGGAGEGSTPGQANNRSIEPSGMRAVPVVNPMVGDEIVVGSWTESPAGNAGPNAVVAVFDYYPDHLSYKIVARTVDGIPVPAPIITSTNYSLIYLRWPYVGLDRDQLRTMIEKHLRLPRDQRP